jgi:hypothetical protein
MEAGLSRHGSDFGNGAADRLFFQVDAELARYLAAKRAVPPSRHAVLMRDAAERAIHPTVLGWMLDTLAHEHPVQRAALAADAADVDYGAIAGVVQEDFAVLRRRDDGGSDAIAVHVCAPSGWCPERIHGASFAAIHGPVPAFAKDPRAERSMVDAMIERGPYVRFVWTVTADRHLDHHPEEGRREPWRADGHGFLRVERQTTVPFAVQQASLFLIRTYLTPFEELTASERGVLARALEALPADVAAYKGLDTIRATVLEVLRRAGPS